MERYPGLDVLIEEFEHVSLAMEDDDTPAITYFKRQRMLREQEESLNNGAVHSDAIEKNKKRGFNSIA